jgi:hypothetical protein
VPQPPNPRSPRKKLDAVQPSNIDSTPPERLELVRIREYLLNPRTRDGKYLAAQTPAGDTAALDVGPTAHAVYVFGDLAKAMDWLKTPTHLFGGQSPEEYAKSGGADEVEKILTRIEYGVFS